MKIFRDHVPLSVSRAVRAFNDSKPEVGVVWDLRVVVKNRGWGWRLVDFLVERLSRGRDKPEGNASLNFTKVRKDVESKISL